MLERRCDRVHIPRLHNDSFNAVAHHIACLTRGDLRQRARRRFICDLGASLPLRRKNVNGALAEITLRVRHKSYDADAIAPEFLQIRLRLFMQKTNQPQLGFWQIQAVPCLQHMLNALAPNQGTGKNSAKFLWPFSRLETLDVHASRQIKEFFFRKSPDPKGVGGFLGQNEQEISQLVLLYETLPLEQQSVFPPLKARNVGCRCCDFRPSDFLFAAVAMPGGDLKHRGYAMSFCHFQRAQTVPRPTMEQIVAPCRQMPRRDPVEIFFFRAVVIGSLKKRNKAHWMPA